MSFHTHIQKINRQDNFVFKEKHLGPRIATDVHYDKGGPYENDCFEFLMSIL